MSRDSDRIRLYKSYIKYHYHLSNISDRISLYTDLELGHGRSSGRLLDIRSSASIDQHSLYNPPASWPRSPANRTLNN